MLLQRTLQRKATIIRTYILENNFKFRATPSERVLVRWSGESSIPELDICEWLTTPF